MKVVLFLYVCIAYFQCIGETTGGWRVFSCLFPLFNAKNVQIAPHVSRPTIRLCLIKAIFASIPLDVHSADVILPDTSCLGGSSSSNTPQRTLSRIGTAL